MTSAASVAVIGCGRWGRFIVRDLVALGADVTVVARSSAAREAATAAGAARTVPAIRNAVGARGIVIATPTITHGEVIRECLGTGLPIYVEKPLAADPAVAAELASAAGERLFVMDKWRYHPAIQALGELARSGELGEVLGLKVVRIQWGSNHGDVDGSWILMPHDLSIVREILGHLPPIRSVVGAHRDGRSMEVNVFLGAGPWAFIESATRFPGGDRREVQLFCARGTAVMANSYEPHISIYRNTNPVLRTPPEPERRKIPTEFPLLRELRAFLEYLDGGPPPKSSAQEGAESAAFIGDIRERIGLTRAATALPEE